MNKVLRAHLALSLSAFLVTPAYARTYTVKSGDTLSGITHREVGGPVWGESGTLEKVKRLNPQVKDANRIYPNDLIRLSDEEESAAEAPAPEAEPAPAEVAEAAPSEAEAAPADSGEVKRNPSDRHRLRILGVMSKTLIEAKAKNGDFKTNLDSDVNTGGEIQYGYYITDNTVVGFTVGLTQSEFSYTKDGRFKGITDNLKKFSLDIEHQLTERLRLNGLVGVQQFYFVTENNATSLTLETVFVDNLGLGVAYDVIRLGAFDAGVDVHGTYASPAKGSSFKVKSGFTYGASVFSGYRFTEMFSLIGNLFYDRRAQDTSGTTQRNSDKGGRLGVQLDF